METTLKKIKQVTQFRNEDTNSVRQIWIRTQDFIKAIECKNYLLTRIDIRSGKCYGRRMWSKSSQTQVSPVCHVLLLIQPLLSIPEIHQTNRLCTKDKNRNQKKTQNNQSKITNKQNNVNLTTFTFGWVLYPNMSQR